MITADARARFQHMQALEDALSFRHARTAEPCPDCGPAGQCADHARDAELIGEYEQTARRLIAEDTGS